MAPLAVLERVDGNAAIIIVYLFIYFFEKSVILKLPYQYKAVINRLLADSRIRNSMNWPHTSTLLVTGQMKKLTQISARGALSLR